MCSLGTTPVICCFFSTPPHPHNGLELTDALEPHIKTHVLRPFQSRWRLPWTAQADATHAASLIRSSLLSHSLSRDSWTRKITLSRAQMVMSPWAALGSPVISFFLRFILFYVYMCSDCTHMHTMFAFGAWCQWTTLRVLGIKPRASARTVNVLNWQVSSPAPSPALYN